MGTAYWCWCRCYCFNSFSFWSAIHVGLDQNCSKNDPLKINRLTEKAYDLIHFLGRTFELILKSKSSRKTDRIHCQYLLQHSISSQYALLYSPWTLQYHNNKIIAITIIARGGEKKSQDLIPCAKVYTWFLWVM